MNRWIAVVITGLLPALSLAQVNAIPAAPHVLVRGHAEGRYVPDRFSVQLMVQATDISPDKARQQVEAHMKSVFEALQANGALKHRTQASSLQINPDYEYRDGKQQYLGSKVVRTVEATFGDLAKLRGFLHDLQPSDEVQVQGTSVERSDSDAIDLALRKQAMVNSQEAAKKIAASYGMRIVGVYSVSEVAPDFAYGFRAGTWPQTDALAQRGAVAPPAPPAPPSRGGSSRDIDLRVGTMQEQQDIYAVYLTAPAK